MVGTVSRPRIGLLIDFISANYQVRLVSGALRAAQRHDVDLACFVGGYFLDPTDESARFEATFICDLAAPTCIDGLLVAASVLSAETGTELVREYCIRQRLPTVGIGELPGFPCVMPDNRAGQRALIEHLIRDHGLRRLAFIRGPHGNADSIEREAIFRETLQEHDLSVREELVLPGNFIEECGCRAVQILLDERKVPLDEVDAIVAANDHMAAGALRELEARGLRVPHQAAVVGFDDDMYARLTTAELTTVRQPVEEIGERAVELLLEALRGEPVPERVVVRTEPVLRRSCGCTLTTEPLSADGEDGGGRLSHALEALRPSCHRRMEHVFRADASAVRAGIDALIDALVQTAQGGEGCLKQLEQALVSMAGYGSSLLRWHDLTYPLDGEVQRYRVRDPGASERCRHLLTEARLLISDTSAKSQSLAETHLLRRSMVLRRFGGALVGSGGFDELAQVLAAVLSALGIEFCCVCLFEAEQAPFTQARIVALYDRATSEIAPYSIGDLLVYPRLVHSPPSSTPPESNASEPPFPSRLLVPPNVTDPPRSLVIHPLVYAGKPLGYALFDQPRDLQDGWISEEVAVNLSNAAYVLLQAEKLRRARVAAEAASSAKSEFVSNMSHELRTPITAITGYVDLCFRTPLSAQQQHFLTRAQTASNALLGIVNDILDFSKIEAGKLDFEHTSFAFDDVLDQVGSTCAMAAANQALEFVLDVAGDVPDGLVGDPLRLGQVLLNLVGNAIKFTKQGEVVLKVRCVEGSPQKATLRFSVSDTGIGLDPDELERLSSPFTQADASTTRRYGGTGLGLAISRRLIVEMGGELSVASELGRGSTFSFAVEFPCSWSRPEAAARQQLGSPVLVVDDNASQLRALVRLLESHQCEVTAASTTAEARSLLERAAAAAAPYGLLLLDQDLPGETGLVFAERLAAHPELRTLPILLMAPIADPELVSQDPAPAVVQGVVAKPIRRASLLQCMRDSVRAGAAGAGLPGRLHVAPETLASLCGKRVLLVDDNEFTREMGRELLQRAGVVVHEATNGREGAQRAASAHYDAVLMDLHMPVMDGWEATRLIRARPATADTPIIAMTASLVPEDRERCFAVGMNDHLTTPVEPQQLLATLATWIETKATQRGSE